MSQNGASSPPVQSNETLFAVVRGLDKLGSATVTELAEYTGNAKSTVHRHLASLYEHEYVVRDGKEYRLGLRFLNLGSKTQQRIEQFEYLKEKLTSIAEETGELGLFVVAEHGVGYHLLCEHGTDAVQTEIHVGSRVNLHQTAPGKAILAHLPRDKVESVIERQGLPGRTEHTITDEDDLYHDIEITQEQGYAMDMGEYIEGLWSVGTAILDDEGTVLGGVGVAAPAHRLEVDWFTETLPESIMSAANEIELQLNYL